MDFNDRILLKLHRQYSKDETVSLQAAKIKGLEKSLKQSEFDKGVLKSELSELEDKVKQLDKQLDDEIKLCKELRNKMSNFDKTLESRVKKYKEQTLKAQKDMRFWCNKFLDLQAKNKKK